MAVEVYFREQIANILNAVNMASGGTANLVGAEMIRCSPVRYVVQEDGSLNNQDDMEDLADHLRLYRQGYRDAIVAVAAALGIADRLQLNTAETGESPFINSPFINAGHVTSRAWQEA